MRPAPREQPRLEVPSSTGLRASKPMSTQEAFGRILVGLSRDEQVGKRLVTTAPDVATSTNLAGFINRTGVFHPDKPHQWSQDPVLRWAEGPTGQHIELGVGAFGQSGTIRDLYEIHDLTPGSIVNGALAALALR